MAAATMPAIQVPWPCGSVAASCRRSPGRRPACPRGPGGRRRHPCRGSRRPRCRPGRSTRSLVPADLRERPLVRVARVVRRAGHGSRAVRLDAEHPGLALSLPRTLSRTVSGIRTVRTGGRGWRPWRRPCGGQRRRAGRPGRRPSRGEDVLGERAGLLGGRGRRFSGRRERRRRIRLGRDRGLGRGRRLGLRGDDRLLGGSRLGGDDRLLGGRRRRLGSAGCSVGVGWGPGFLSFLAIVAAGASSDATRANVSTATRVIQVIRRSLRRAPVQRLAMVSRTTRCYADRPFPTPP